LTIFRACALMSFFPDVGWWPVRIGGIAGRHQ
jgi:hypothetical protein